MGRGSGARRGLLGGDLDAPPGDAEPHRPFLDHRRPDRARHPLVSGTEGRPAQLCRRRTDVQSRAAVGLAPGARNHPIPCRTLMRPTTWKPGTVSHLPGALRGAVVVSQSSKAAAWTFSSRPFDLASQTLDFRRSTI